MAIPLSKRLPQLDRLRAFACLAVIIFHYPFPHTFLTTYGWTGVDLFFVISGFLITGILMRTREKDDYFQTFYMRRALRIWPLYYFAVTAIFVGFWLHVLRPAPEQPYWVFALYLQNILGPSVINWRSLSVTWSLAVEEQFYLAWPLLCWKTSKRILGWVCIGLLIQAPITRLILAHAGWDALRIRHLPFCCVDGLAAGALLALWIDSPAASPEKMKWMSLLSLGVGALMFWRLSTVPELSVAWAFSYSFLAIGFCGLVGASLLRGSQAAAFSPVVYLGKISYGLYLYHPLAIAILVRTMHRPTLVPYAAVVLTIIMAALSFHFFESIFLGLKEKLAPAP